MTRCAAVLGFVLCSIPNLAAGSDPRSNGESRSDVEVRKLPGGALLRVAPGTVYSLGRPMNVQLGTKPGKTLAQTLRLSHGRVEIDLPATKVPTAAVLVQGPSRISAIAKGGHSVVIADQQRVTVAAVAGDMLVATGDDWRTLVSGVVRDYSGKGQTDHNVLPAPHASLSTPVALSFAGEGEGASVHASTTTLSHANGYEFGLWSLHGKERSLLKRFRTQSESVPLGALTAGSYGVTVHAVEASGLEGAESELIPLRVVSAELPDGARFSGDSILLPPNQRVRLLGTDGVEISYGKVASFVPAPSTIGLIRGESTLVRLRAQGASEELSLNLAPRAAHANVTLSPARAHWPSDPIAIHVELTDSRGQPLADDVVVTPSVSVNVTPVPVTWKRTGNVMSATLPPAPGSGPWVVRVEVLDDTKSVVGRNFLEVASQAVASQ